MNHQTTSAKAGPRQKLPSRQRHRKEVQWCESPLHGEATANCGELERGGERKRETNGPTAISTTPLLLSESHGTLLKSKHGGTKKKRASILLE